MIISVNLSDKKKQRFSLLGIQPNKHIRYINTTIWQDPFVYQIGNTLIAIRKSDARHILVER